MTPSVKRPQFQLPKFDLPATLAKKHVAYNKGQIIFSPGDLASNVFYIRQGTVKLAILSQQGKEAVVAILGMGHFVGETCLGVELHRLVCATALSRCTLLQIAKQAVQRLLHEDRVFADHFMTYLLSRTVKVEEDLADQLFNSTEKRLARALLLLGHYGTEEKSVFMAPRISQTTLAEMVGTTRPRVNVLMNKFRKLGFIEYNDGLHVHSSLLDIVLHD